MLTLTIWKLGQNKVDKFVKGDLVSKARDILEARIFPTAKIIGDVTPTSSEIFVDNIQFFNYEEEIYTLTHLSAISLIPSML